MGWKDWVIGVLWIATLSLAGLGYSSIEKSIKIVQDGQAKHTEVMSELKIQYEKDKGVMWRVIDKLCIYQSERLLKEGKMPNYTIPDSK